MTGFFSTAVNEIIQLMQLINYRVFLETLTKSIKLVQLINSIITGFFLQTLMQLINHRVFLQTLMKLIKLMQLINYRFFLQTDAETME